MCTHYTLHEDHPLNIYQLTRRRKSGKMLPGFFVYVVGGLAFLVSINGFQLGRVEGRSSFKPKDFDSPLVISKYVMKEIINAKENGNVDEIMEYCQQEVEYIDSDMLKPIIGKRALRKFFLSTQMDKRVIDDIPVSSDGDTDTYLKCSILYRLSRSKRKGIVFINLRLGKICKVLDVKESQSSIAVASDYKRGSWMRRSVEDDTNIQLIPDETCQNVAMTFLNAKNHQNITAAIECFSEECVYENPNLKSKKSLGKSSLREDILTLDEVISSPVHIVVDDMIVMSGGEKEDEKIAVSWHLQINGEILRFRRGCSFFFINKQSGLIQSCVEISEAPDKAAVLSMRSKVPVFLQTFGRDSGLFRGIIDFVSIITAPFFTQQHEGSFNNFITLTRQMETIKYGGHPKQKIQLFRPKAEIKGTVFFIVRMNPLDVHLSYLPLTFHSCLYCLVIQKHGGAWGTGEPWLYRLTALPFLENNQAVVVVGYRTYPDGLIQDQVNDVELAIQTLASRYPLLVNKPYKMQLGDWLGINLIGHSRYRSPITYSSCSNLFDIRPLSLFYLLL